MHARVTSAQIQPGKMDELMQLFKESVLPAAKQHQGFKGMLVLADPSQNKGIAITLWETEADLQTSESGYYQEQLVKASHLLAGSSVRERYEVAVQDL